MKRVVNLFGDISSVFSEYFYIAVLTLYFDIWRWCNLNVKTFFKCKYFVSFVYDFWLLLKNNYRSFIWLLYRIINVSRRIVYLIQSMILWHVHFKVVWYFKGKMISSKTINGLICYTRNSIEGEQNLLFKMQQTWCNSNQFSFICLKCFLYHRRHCRHRDR